MLRPHSSKVVLFRAFEFRTSLRTSSLVCHYYQIQIGVYKTFATGAASQQWALAPSDTSHLGHACIVKLRPVYPGLVMFPDFGLR